MEYFCKRKHLNSILKKERVKVLQEYEGMRGGNAFLEK